MSFSPRKILCASVALSAATLNSGCTITPVYGPSVGVSDPCMLSTNCQKGRIITENLRVAYNTELTGQSSYAPGRELLEAAMMGELAIDVMDQPSQLQVRASIDEELPWASEFMPIARQIIDNEGAPVKRIPTAYDLENNTPSSDYTVRVRMDGINIAEIQGRSTILDQFEAIDVASRGNANRGPADEETEVGRTSTVANGPR